MAYSHEASPPTVVRRTARNHRTRAGALAMPRRRGVGAGILLLLLGIWGAIIPFVGPLFDYRIDNAGAWVFTWDRLWLSVLPGAAAFLGGLILIAAADRLTATVGAWLSFAAGAWFVVGPSVSLLWGSPLATNGIGAGSDVQRFIEQIGYFYGLGAVVIGLAAGVWARVLVRSERDALLLETSTDTVTESAEAYAEPADPQRPVAVHPYATTAGSAAVAADVPPGAEVPQPRRAAVAGDPGTDPMAERRADPLITNPTDPMAAPGVAATVRRGTDPMAERDLPRDRPARVVTESDRSERRL